MVHGAHHASAHRQWLPARPTDLAASPGCGAAARRRRRCPRRATPRTRRRRRPLGVGDREPVGVPVASLVDHRVAEPALVGEAVPDRSPSRRLVAGVALPLSRRWPRSSNAWRISRCCASVAAPSAEPLAVQHRGHLHRALRRVDPHPRHDALERAAGARARSLVGRARRMPRRAVLRAGLVPGRLVGTVGPQPRLGPWARSRDVLCGEGHEVDVRRRERGARGRAPRATRPARRWTARTRWCASWAHLTRWGDGIAPRCAQEGRPGRRRRPARLQRRAGRGREQLGGGRRDGRVRRGRPGGRLAHRRDAGDAERHPALRVAGLHRRAPREPWPRRSPPPTRRDATPRTTPGWTCTTTPSAGRTASPTPPRSARAPARRPRPAGRGREGEVGRRRAGLGQAPLRRSRMAAIPACTSAYDVDSGESPIRRPPGSR